MEVGEKREIFKASSRCRAEGLCKAWYALVRVASSASLAVNRIWKACSSTLA